MTLDDMRQDCCPKDKICSKHLIPVYSPTKSNCKKCAWATLTPWVGMIILCILCPIMLGYLILALGYLAVSETNPFELLKCETCNEVKK